MGQQPNIELGGSTAPTPELDRGAERRWSPRRPGEISSPGDVPTGASFGRPGPDTGWALRLLRNSSYDRGDRPRELADVLAAIVGARASIIGRSPVPQDIEAALTISGLRPQGMTSAAIDHLSSQRRAWLDSAAHEPSPGMAAIDAIPSEILLATPEVLTEALSSDPSLVG